MSDFCNENELPPPRYLGLDSNSKIEQNLGIISYTVRI